MPRLTDLTGIANRRGWLDQTRRTLAATGTGMLLLCDIDRFKAVNDSFGHAAGDVVLTEVARILSRHGNARRLGGDEFAVWRPDVDEQLAGRIVREVEDTLQGEISTHTRVSISIGIATAPDTDANLATLLELADSALYAAKRDGGGRAKRPPAPPERRQRPRSRNPRQSLNRPTRARAHDSTRRGRAPASDMRPRFVAATTALAPQSVP